MGRCESWLNRVTLRGRGEGAQGRLLVVAASSDWIVLPESVWPSRTCVAAALLVVRLGTTLVIVTGYARRDEPGAGYRVGDVVGNCALIAGEQFVVGDDRDIPPD